MGVGPEVAVGEALAGEVALTGEVALGWLRVEVGARVKVEIGVRVLANKSSVGCAREGKLHARAGSSHEIASKSRWKLQFFCLIILFLISRCGNLGKARVGQADQVFDREFDIETALPSGNVDRILRLGGSVKKNLEAAVD